MHGSLEFWDSEFPIGFADDRRTETEALMESASKRVDMHLRESGTSGSPAVVFLHGVGNSGRMWKGHMAEMSGFHCLAPDLPGFGDSNQLAWTSRTDISDRVAALIRSAIPGGKAHVVGLSLGGSIAHTMLGRHPELLDRVVIDGCGVLPWWGIGLIKTGVVAMSPFLHTRPLIRVVGNAFGLDEEAQADMQRASPAAFRRGFAEANSTRITATQLEAPCPTLLVAGEFETKPPVRASNAALAGLMPHAEARYVVGCGHGWIGEKPDLHRRMVQAWLTGEDLPPGLEVETTRWDRSVTETIR